MAGLVEKRIIPCNLCGSEGYTVRFADELEDSPPALDYNFTPATRKTYQIVSCDCCGLVYTNPMPYLSKLYKDTVDDTYLRSGKQRLKTASKLLQDILRFRQGGRLLDIGCSTGILLDVASQHFAVEGIETSTWSYREASKRHKVYNVPLSELDCQERYDVVTLLGVIEHFENPRKELAAIHRVTNPGGLLVVYTGDVSAWIPRLLGKQWWWYQGMHTFYFSRKTCASLLEQCGFTVVAVKNHTLYFQLYSLAISLNRYRVGKWLSHIFNCPFVRDVMIPVKLSGEILILARKE